MKARTKIALLLFIVVATFVGGLIAVKAHDRRRFREVAAARAEERQRSFDEFLKHSGESLETFAKYFSTWDEMVAAIAQENQEWVEANLHEHTLNSYRAHAVWAYRPDGTVAFNRCVLEPEGMKALPLPPGAMSRLFEKGPFCHFFVQTPPGLMEIRGTTVHRSNDSGRAGAPRGYFFVGRLWSNQDLKEMSLFTGDKFRLVRPADAGTSSPHDDASAVVSFSRLLPGWDGQPIAALAVRNESPVIKQLLRSSERLFWALLIFAIFLFLVLVLALTQWVTRPLSALSLGLKAQDPVRIRPLQASRDEFGDFARLMGAFFEQRRELLREMSERVHTQEALHESEERLRQSQKMEAIGRLAGGIAHDFNNLLTAIIGYSELIAIGSTEPTIREEAEMIRKAGGQAADLTRQLLAFSRKQVLQPRVVDLNALLLDLQKLLQRLIGEHIDLRVHADAERARVRADPTQLEQVVMNLAVNARDAMPRGGTLTLRTANLVVAPPDPDQQSLDGDAALAPGNYIVITAEDTGVGMDADTRARVFEPFFTTKSAGKGTGLGLATVYGIVQQSGGTIQVESEPGSGAKFTIYLLQADAPLDLPRPPSTVQRHSKPAETVLVVEDERIVRDLVCAVLTEQGYDVVCAPSGMEGLRLAKAHPRSIDLLLTDIIMPQMGGLEVAGALRSEQPHVKVLFVSGYSDEVLTGSGADPVDLRFLEKPFTPETLCRTVRDVLDEPGAT